jgi:hypothetical protein
MPQQQPLHQQTNHTGRRDRKDNSKKEVAGQFRERRGKVSAQHEEHAVREVYEAHDSEDQAESRCDQEEHHAQLNAVQQLLNQ